ncbi:MAG: hypothetical protein IT392_13105 [Nitrospirae bacterium]|nr:hypothetical protein [Nitrospirota bacterium]
MKKYLWLSPLIIITAILSLSHPSIADQDMIDWNKIKNQSIKLFYPGVVSWDFLISNDHGLGGKNIPKGKKNCVDCHLRKTGELDLQVNGIADGKLMMKYSQKSFEPEPISGKKSFLNLHVQAAYDDDYFYIKLQWQSQGSSWNNAKLSDGGLVDRVAIQISHANYDKGYLNRYGCFVTCHNDLNSMPESPSKDKVKGQSYYGALKRDDVRLYAYYTRKGGWADFKKPDDLKMILKNNGLIDIWKVEFNGKSVTAEDGWIFEDRRDDEKNDIKAEGSWDNGKYTVIIKRKLDTNDQRDVQLKEGDILILGVAVHDENTSRRRHYVNLPVTIGIGTDGDIRAEKVKEYK